MFNCLPPGALLIHLLLGSNSPTNPTRNWMWLWSLDPLKSVAGALVSHARLCVCQECDVFYEVDQLIQPEMIS